MNLTQDDLARMQSEYRNAKDVARRDFAEFLENNLQTKEIGNAHGDVDVIIDAADRQSMREVTKLLIAIQFLRGELLAWAKEGAQ
jgi:hypothetical protein